MRKTARRRNDSDSEEEEDDEAEKKDVFNPKIYYERGDTLKNSVMLLIKVIGKFQDKVRNNHEESHGRILGMLESLVLKILG